LDATRAAVLEHERLEAALHALGDAGSRATHAVRGRGSGAAGSARPSSAAAKHPGARAPADKRRSAAAGKPKRAGGARAGGASATARVGRQRGRPGAGDRAAGGKQATAGASAAAGTGGRAPRGAKRAAVLRVIGERPGVSARELAAASQVTGGTLYSLLRRLADDGTIEKRELPGGQTGYALATGPAHEQSAAAPRQSATSDDSGVQARAAAQPKQDRADSTQPADDAPSAANETQTIDTSRDESTDADETSTRLPGR
jgi:hypothetical protein